MIGRQRGGGHGEAAKCSEGGGNPRSEQGYGLSVREGKASNGIEAAGDFAHRGIIN